jgi:hypothetical protein
MNARRHQPDASLEPPASSVASVEHGMSAMVKIDGNVAERRSDSREASTSQAAIKRKQRRFTTGRNQQLNFKATAQTVERLYRLADERKLTLCETLELALDALERSSTSQ